jgi:hypothetical protein
VSEKNCWSQETHTPHRWGDGVLVHECNGALYIPKPTPVISPDLMEEIALLCTTKGHREGTTGAREGYEFPAHVALAHTELSEVIEAYRDKVWSETREDGKPIGVGPELADTIIRVLDLFQIWGLDPDYEIRRVLAYNWTRPYKHGGRNL